MYGSRKRKKENVAKGNYVVSSDSNASSKKEPRKRSGGCGCGKRTKRSND